MVVYVSVGRFNDGVLEPSNDLVELPNPLEVLRGTSGRYLNPSTSTFHLHVIVLGGGLSLWLSPASTLPWGPLGLVVSVLLLFLEVVVEQCDPFGPVLPI
jgi:hypothetical protein